MNRPLRDLRVVEVCQNLAGPLCGKILADMGADVIKVEPPEGDAARSWAPPFHAGVGTIFAYANTGKRGIRLDLRSDAGMAVLRRLVERADVLVESLRPGALARLGMGWEAARTLNDRLVYASVLAYGEEGPLRELPGYEPLMQAHGGLLSYTGEKGGTPVRVGTSVVDMGTGMWTAIGVLAALRERDATGHGSRVSGALFDTALTWSGYHLLGALSEGAVATPMGTELPMIVPYGTFPTRTGPVMISVGNDRIFQRFCEALGLDDLASDPRFAHGPDRVAHRDEINARVREATAAFTVDDLIERLRDAGVPAAPVKDVGELLDDDQLRASGMMAEDAEGRPYGALPLRWDGARPEASGRLPDHDTDAVGILDDLGIVDDDVRDGVLGEPREDRDG
ncbi:MAG TPA: CoA transferase [Longimicrobiales bacterium]|nr:CoA transferase [Longimicrobiales bacterium]